MSAFEFANRWLAVITAAYVYVCGMLAAYFHAAAWAILQ